MSNQQYNHLLQVIADLGQQMSEGFATVNARLDKLEARADAIEARLDAIETRLNIIEEKLNHYDRNFISIYEILQDVIEILPKKRTSAKSLLAIKNSKRLLQGEQP